MSPTGFFHLPLEMRQRIYDFILPSDGKVTLSAPQGLPQETHTINALSCADPKLLQEMRHWTRYRDYGIRLIISTDSDFKALDLRTFTLSHVHEVEIVIDYLHWTLFPHIQTQDADEQGRQFVRFMARLPQVQRLELRSREPTSLQPRLSPRFRRSSAAAHRLAFLTVGMDLPHYYHTPPPALERTIELRPRERTRLSGAAILTICREIANYAFRSRHTCLSGYDRERFLRALDDLLRPDSGC